MGLGPSGNSGDALIISLAIALILFVAGREFVCWYLKINQTLEVLRSIDLSLRMLPGVREKRGDPDDRRLHRVA